MQRLKIEQFYVADTYQQDVTLGLTHTPKFLQPKYFYDERGSHLFEAICDLPEYYPTRTETQILQSAALNIFRLIGICELVELGSGSSTKTRILLDALTQLDYPQIYLPVDVSAKMLISSSEDLIDTYPNLTVQALVADYEHVWSGLPLKTLPRRVVIFLGSTLGNFSAQECDKFLTQVSSALEPGDCFLLGVDLQKPVAVLEAAYNDAQGVTAQFNLNLLRRLNQDFDGNFDLTKFKHWAFYNQDLQQIEMHLRSVCTQEVFLKKLGLTVDFLSQETIHTESSRKFDLSAIKSLLAQKSLPVTQTWQDQQGWFGLLLAQKTSDR